MAKVGRNEVCPCGSGRKYKRCCGASAPVAGVVSSLAELSESLDRLEAMRWAAQQKLNRGDYAGAEHAALELQKAFPSDPDGMEMLGEIWAKSGDRERAAGALRTAAQMNEHQTPPNREVAAWLREQADRMDQGLDFQWPNRDLD